MEEKSVRGEGTTLGDIFRVIFSQKWLALILAAVLTAVCVVGLYFGYNKSKKHYSVSFELELAGSENSEQQVHKYPDGNTFNYRNIISYDNMQNVKNGDSSFAGVNINGLAENGCISITRSITQLTENSYETVYTISAKADKFPDGVVARNFLTALAAMPDRYLATMDIDYNVYLTTSENAVDYRTEIGDLLKQANYLSEQYDKLIKTYGDVIVNDGKTLTSYKQKIASYVDDGKVLSNLLTVAEDGLYLKSESLKEKYRFDLTQLELDLTKAENTLQNLLHSDDTSGSASNALVIKEQSDLVEDLKRDKTLYQNYIDRGITGAAIPESFLTSLDEAHKTVTAYTEEFKQVTGTVYSKSSSVIFTSANVISTSGGMGLTMIVILSLAFGIIVSFIVSYIVGYCLAKRHGKKAKLPEHAQDVQPTEQVESPFTEQ